MPYYRFTLETRLSPMEAIARVGGLVEPPQGLWQSFKAGLAGRRRDGKPFQGVVEANGFRIQRRIPYRNSFLPRIRGTVSPGPGGATVAVTLHIHPLVALFMMVWLAMPITGAVLPLLASRPASLHGTLFPVMMAAAGIGVVLVGFIPEVIKARRLLEANLLDPNARPGR